MSMYISADTVSGHPLSGSGKMIPRGLHRRGTNTVFPRAMCPGASTITKNPDHIMINNSGSYYFKYDTTGSIGDSDAGGDSPYELGIMVHGRAGGATPDPVSPVRLDISPCAWSGSHDPESTRTSRTGDITFVYKGKG